MNDRYLHQTARCPACEEDYLTSNVGAVYGLHPADYDDVFTFGLCTKCAHIVNANKDDPYRLRLKNRLERYIDDFSNDPLHGKVAVSTLKVLEVHNGVFADAIEIGWPYETPVDQCNVTTLLGGMRIVTVKDRDHES